MGKKSLLFADNILGKLMEMPAWKVSNYRCAVRRALIRTISFLLQEHMLDNRHTMPTGLAYAQAWIGNVDRSGIARDALHNAACNLDTPNAAPLDWAFEGLKQLEGYWERESYFWDDKRLRLVRGSPKWLDNLACWASGQSLWCHEEPDEEPEFNIPATQRYLRKLLGRDLLQELPPTALKHLGLTS